MSTPIPNPFSKISTQLLRGIFEHVCENNPVQIPLQPLDPRYHLSLVCRRWVITVRSTLSLWDDIYFTKPLPETVHTSDPLLHHFSLCTERSGQNPLAIAFDMFCEGWEFSIVRSVILPNVHRIRSLSCPIYSNHDIKEFLTMNEGQLKELESIEICFINMWARPASSFSLDDCLQFNALHTVPNLRKATFRLLNGMHPIDLHLPWGQLTTLDLGTTALAPETLIKILHSTTMHLEDGCFYIKLRKLLCPRRILSKQIVTMHSLRTLRLRLLFPTQDTRIFSLLRFPSLQYLWVEMHDVFQDWDLALYTGLLQASTKTLRLLHLIDIPAPASEDSSIIVTGTRRYRKITQRALKKFFKVISNVASLYLPLGVYIHAPIVDEIASCALLPMLYEFELGTIDGWHMITMARQRYIHCFNASLANLSEFEKGSSQQPFPKPLAPLRYLYIMIPRHSYSARAKTALITEAQALAMLGITCNVLSTASLPLPIIKPSPTAEYITQCHLPA